MKGFKIGAWRAIGKGAGSGGPAVKTWTVLALGLALGSPTPVSAQLTTTDAQLLTKGGFPAQNDFFGYALATGDFDGDGFSDLAIGAPGVDDSSADQAGSVDVLYGGSAGLAPQQSWAKHVNGVPGSSELDDFFGWAVASGDFDGDHYDDLAIGVPGEDDDSGAVIIVYGSNNSLSQLGVQAWSQETGTVEGSSEPGDLFGQQLATGDFDGDGYADLAIGVPHEDVGTITEAGAVNILYGTSTGLSGADNQIWHQDSTDVEDQSEAFDHFGAALTSADFDNDGYDDLAIGVPGEDKDGLSDTGGVSVLYGSNTGLRSQADQFWHQDTNLQGSAEEDDRFGSSLASGFLDDDDYADLAIGVPGEDIGALENAGVVNVLYGGAPGLTVAGDQLWSQASSGVAGIAEATDVFGSSLAIGSFVQSGHQDLAIGAYLEDVNGSVNAGGVNVLYSDSSGLTAVGNQLWHQDVQGTPSGADASEYFGWSLAAGDFDGNGQEDLAIGAYAEIVETQTGAGTVMVLYAMQPGSLFIDGFESGDLSAWN